MDAEEYKFPEIYQFPPFFTIQPNEATRTRQLELWADIIVNYCKKHRIFRFDLSEMSAARDSVASNLASKDPSRTEDPPSLGQIFANQKIDRKLNNEALKIIIDHLIVNNLARWHPKKSNSTGLILWKNIDEWSKDIYDWAIDTGRSGMVCTLHEIINSDLTKSKSFNGLDITIAILAVEALGRDKKAALFRGLSPAELGVKFV